MNKDIPNWEKGDSLNSIKQVYLLGKTALAGFISWASEVPSRIDTHMAGGDIEDE